MVGFPANSYMFQIVSRVDTLEKGVEILFGNASCMSTNSSPVVPQTLIKCLEFQFVSRSFRPCRKTYREGVSVVSGVFCWCMAPALCCSGWSVMLSLKGWSGIVITRNAVNVLLKVDMLEEKNSTIQNWQSPQNQEIHRTHPPTQQQSPPGTLPNLCLPLLLGAAPKRCKNPSCIRLAYARWTFI